MESTKARLIRLNCYHEAGHVAVMLHFGMEFDSIVIHRRNRCKVTNFRETNRTNRNHIAMLYAGTIAEEKYAKSAGISEPGFTAWGERLDRQFIQKLLQECDGREDLEAISRGIVEERYASIVRIAEALIERCNESGRCGMSYADAMKLYAVSPQKDCL